MLHDPSHVTAVPIAEKIELRPEERDILRKLGETYAAIAMESAHEDKAALWTNLNDLKSQRPMVWINEIPWHEMNVNDELTHIIFHPDAY